MLRNRLLILLGGCFLLASAAWADDIGYVDCRNHPEETQVFPKARQTHETVASLPCGERFTVLLNGFIFSRIQTADGKIGYIYSSAITADHSGAAVLRPAAKQAPAATPSAAVTTAADAPPKAQDAVPATVTPETAASVAQANTTSVAPAPAARVQPAAAPAGFPTPAAVQEATIPAAQANAASVTPSEPASTQGTHPETAASVERPNATSAEQPQPTSVTGQPQPSTNSEASQPEPAPVQPATPAIRPANERWEKPNPGTHHAALIELFGGYSFARLNNGAGTMTNMSGALGSFGWNAKPWLQVVADTSYNVVTVSGVKNVLYGNHYGPRLFYNGRYRWGFTPFVEGLVGGSRADTSTSGTYAASTSVNCLSFKVGGGFDMKPMRHLTIRVLDFDYYRTAFGTNLHQNNYWASTGIVLRLFGAGAE